MTFKTGTATDYGDLLTQLRTWLTGTCGWTQLYYSTTGGKGQTDPFLLSLQAPGSGSGRNVFVNIRGFSNAPLNVYSWAISAATGYQASAAWGVNPGESAPVYFNTWNSEIDYWFYANDRRFVIIAKCSTAYISAYAGFFLPWAEPQQYPFPLYVGADYFGGVAWNYTNSGRRMFCDPGGSGISRAAYARTPDGPWVGMYNQQNTPSNDSTYGYTRGDNRFVWPYAASTDQNSVSSWASGVSSGSSGGGIFDTIDLTAQGDRLILPVHILSATAPAIGVLDGVYCPLGIGLVTEQTVTAAGKTLRAFQNILRNSANDFFLMDEL